MVVILSFIVGILTALGVLVILRPISRIRDALVRVGEGQRGVHLAKTGYNELDDLITQLNQAARAMELREDETEGRLRLMQEMARIVAHEVRNPLQTIELMTSLLEDEQSTSERHEITESLHQEIRNLDQVVTSFLEKGSTIESLSIQTKVRSLTQIVEQTLYIHRYAAEKLGIKLNARNLQDVDADIDTALLSRAADNIIREVLSLVAAKTGVITIEMTSNQTPGILITATGLKHFPTARDNFRKQTTLAFGVFQAHQGVIQVDQVEDTIVVSATLPPVVAA
jgi:signal transduction histidine kinase